MYTKARLFLVGVILAMSLLIASGCDGENHDGEVKAVMSDAANIAYDVCNAAYDALH